MSSLPGAGWYDDGTTIGVLRWFDGTGWTEHTRALSAPVPAPAQAQHPAQQPIAAVTPSFGTPAGSFGAQPTGFASTVPTRLGQSANLAESVTQGAAYQQNRHDEALGLRRRGFWMFGGAVAILLVTGLIGLVTGASGTLWYLSAGGAVFLLVRAWRDYQNATFRGAPTLNVLTWVGAGVALAAAVAFFVVGPAIGALGTMGS